MLVSGGMSYIVPDVMEQIQGFGLDGGRIRKLLILHAHFDHVGAVPYLKRTYPEMEVYASSRAWDLLGTLNVVETINQFSRAVAARMGRAEACDALDLEWRGDVFGTPVSDGDRIDLGDLEVQVLETPGHSSCSISAYVPQLKALFPSDGGGIPFKDTIIMSGNSNYTHFQRSLERLLPFEVDYLCADHYGYISGQEARGFIPQAIERARQTRAAMEEAYCRTRDVDGAARELCDAFFRENPDYILTPAIFEGVFRQMVRHIAKEMDGRDVSV